MKRRPARKAGAHDGGIHRSTGMSVPAHRRDAPQRIREKAANGTYIIQRQYGGRGGNSGESYQIAVSSLPAEARIRYPLRTGALGGQGRRRTLRPTVRSTERRASRSCWHGSKRQRRGSPSAGCRRRAAWSS
ncbi:MAG: hypothetical protein ACLSAF_00270 [Intestinimonas sp.]